MATNRWASYIDIEGFGNLYGKDVGLSALRDLMEGIFLVSEKYCPESPNRIFAHQSGDGFVLVGEFNPKSWVIPITITIALLRHVAARGRFAKAALGEGDFADITDCYPRSVLEARNESGTVRMGQSVMTLFPVMGSALIDAVGIQKRAPSGALFVISKDNISRVPSDCILKEDSESKVVAIDWVGCRLKEIEKIQTGAGLMAPNPNDINAQYASYIHSYPPPKKWQEGTAEYANLGTYSCNKSSNMECKVSVKLRFL